LTNEQRVPFTLRRGSGQALDALSGERPVDALRRKRHRLKPFVVSLSNHERPETLNMDRTSI
jgi:hypothetical protein